MSGPEPGVAELVTAARSGDPRALARLISVVENQAPGVREVTAAVTPYTGRARVVGLTGAPGVGKSTCTAALVAGLRARGERVAVLAVDPSSPFSGGALLGDRIRMQMHATDAGVYIRSMATRGHLGGLAATAPQALRVLDAAGFATVLVETVGVGQAEVEVAAHADTTLVLLAPGMGDGIQAAKAGILEIGDVLIVNKADRDGAQTTARELRQMLRMGPHLPGGWSPPVLLTTAASGEGVDEVLAAVDRHGEWLRDTGELGRRRRDRAAAEVTALVLAAVRRRLEPDGDLHGRATTRATEVVDALRDAFDAADDLLAAL